jgi:sigma-B regulation protein RsbU (phosphoserine phosphatase)
MGDGFAVGFFDDSEYSPIETVLEPGDVLLIYTDGISEAQNRSMETYGLDRLGAALASCPAESSAAEMLSEVLDKFDTFREERILKDDVTAIVLKRCQ